ncbi:MAG: hypothetical protein JO341_11530 [Gammaproteobacteria bacterium]|nr:hypothetical protein [Gammaproteobacteria bacterium]
MIEIARFARGDDIRLRAFNARLAASGFRLPTTPEELSTPAEPGAGPWTDLWVAHVAGTVRGGYLLKHETLWLRGKTTPIGNFQLPLSEGILDRRFAAVGLALAQHAQRQADALYSLGMGDVARPLPKLLARLGWRVEPVPFYFRILNGGAVARHLRAFDSTAARRALRRSLAASGLASAGAWAWRVAARLAGPRRERGLRLVAVDRFDERVDEVQSQCLAAYPALLDRRAVALNIKFPAGDPRLLRFLLKSEGRVAGWLVLSCNLLRDHKQFGDLRLGCLVDGLCAPHQVAAAVWLASRELAAAGVDLIVSNQAHRAWRRGLRANLFLAGPSNFILARTAAFAPAVALPDLHVNRGDGDGPINL